MATIIWKEAKPCGTAKSRYKARRAAQVAERRSDDALARSVAQAVTGCSDRVLKALNTETYGRQLQKAIAHHAPLAIKREEKRYRENMKVLNEAGRQIHAVQKQRGKSIPLI